jgi:hypothetical protein
VRENGEGLRRLTSWTSASEDHRHPRFLPDGIRFLFTQRSLSAAKAGIWVGRTDDTETHRLFADESMAEYVETPTGASYIFFVRGSDLVAQPVESEDADANGDARRDRAQHADG